MTKEELLALVGDNDQAKTFINKIFTDYDKAEGELVSLQESLSGKDTLITALKEEKESYKLGNQVVKDALGLDKITDEALKAKLAELQKPKDGSIDIDGELKAKLDTLGSTLSEEVKKREAIEKMLHDKEQEAISAKAYNEKTKALDEAGIKFVSSKAKQDFLRNTEGLTHFVDGALVVGEVGENGIVRKDVTAVDFYKQQAKEDYSYLVASATDGKSTPQLGNAVGTPPQQKKDVDTSKMTASEKYTYLKEKTKE